MERMEHEYSSVNSPQQIKSLDLSVDQSVDQSVNEGRDNRDNFEYSNINIYFS